VIFTNAKVTIADIVEDSDSTAGKVKASSAVGRAAQELFFTKGQIKDLVFIAASGTDKTSYGITDQIVANYELTEKDIVTIVGLAKTNVAFVDTVLKEEIAAIFPSLTADEISKLTKEKRAGAVALKEFAKNRTQYTVTTAATTATQYDTGFTDAELLALGTSRLDVLNGKENTCTIRAKSYAALIKAGTEFKTVAGYDSAKYKAALVTSNTKVPAGDKGTDDQVYEQLAWLQVTAEIGQKPRTKAELQAFTRDLKPVCDLWESDFAKLEGGKYFDGSAVTNICSPYKGVKDADFVYTEEQVKSTGLTIDEVKAAWTKDQVRILICGTESIKASLATYQKDRAAVASLSVIDTLKYYGYTEDYIIKASSLNFQNIIDYNLTLDAVATFVLQYTYVDKDSTGKITARGYASQQFKSTALQAGLTKEIIEKRQMSKLDVIKRLTEFSKYSTKDSRSVLSFSSLIQSSNADDKARLDVLVGRVDSLKTLTSDDLKQTFLYEQGLVCKEAFTKALVGTATNAKSILDKTSNPSYKLDGADVQYCDRFTSTTSSLYQAAATADDLIAPLTNVDLVRRVLTSAKFSAIVTSGADAKYTYDNFLAAVAYFPAICDTMRPLESCKQQLAAFFAITSQLTKNGSTQFALTKEVCTAVDGSNACKEYPVVESIAAHFMYPLHGTSAQTYQGRGAGMIKGMEQYWRFSQAMGIYYDGSVEKNLQSDAAATTASATTKKFPARKTIFADTEKVATDGVLAWASGLWRFLTPVTYDKTVSFTELNSPSTTPQTYTVEDSYMSPSANSWLLGQNKSNAGYMKTFTETTIVTTGFRGVLKTYYPTACKTSTTDSAVTGAASNFSTYLTQLGGTAVGTSTCTNTSAEAFQENEDFKGPFYFSQAVEAISEDGATFVFYAAAGTCLNTYLATPYRTFDTGAYRECVADNYTQYYAPAF